MYCRICGRTADEERLCKECKMHIEDGADEEVLRRMYGDDRVKEIWNTNKKLADCLAQAYFGYVWTYYERKAKTDSKENLGFNTFADGIRMGLDITIPLVDDETQTKINRKIADMLIERRKRK